MCVKQHWLWAVHARSEGPQSVPWSHEDGKSSGVEQCCVKSHLCPEYSLDWSNSETEELSTSEKSVSLSFLYPFSKTELHEA